MNVHFRGFEPKGLAFINETQAHALNGSFVEHNDVLLNITGASIGRVTLAPENMHGARVNQHVSIIRTNGAMDHGFLRHFLACPKQQSEIMGSQYGATRQALTKEMILDFEVPFPPLNEQRRIVAKLDALMAKSRRAKEALDAIPPLLDKLRQSILAAAFRGDLTADWRAAHPDVEPASQLLQRIRAERRRRWEEAELAKLKANGKTPTDDRWKAKYQEPEPVDESGLPELPEGWCWASLDELTSLITSGSRGWAEYYASDGATFIRSQDINTDRLVLEDAAFVQIPGGAEGSRTRVQTGDLLITITGANVTRTALVQMDIGEAFVSQHVAMLRPIEAEVFPLTHRYLTSEVGGRRELKRLAYGGGKPGLNLEQLRVLAVPIPPASERSMLEDRLNELLTGVARQQDSIREAAAALPKLEARLLIKAFRGELVPQDPNDEPASVLLERIRSESGVQTKTRGRRARSKTA